MDIPVRRHGPPGRSVLVLHGGPGAPGSAMLLARALADPLHVVEPSQRLGSSIPLTVATHVADVADVIASHVPGEKPAIVGESWGATLALAFASAHPDRVSALALVGCGTFDGRARARLKQTLAERTTPDLTAQLAALRERVADEADRMARAHAILDPVYVYRRALGDPLQRMDLKGHTETWNDMLRLQEAGVYPMIRDGLQPFIPQLEYEELDRCGHAPWVEEHARDRFLARLRSWLWQQGRAERGA